MISNLPKSALDEIPAEQENAKEITKLIKESNKIIGYEIADEYDVTKEEAIDMTKHGLIKGVGIAHNKNNVYIKSIPDNSEVNNLSNLATKSK